MGTPDPALPVTVALAGVTSASTRRLMMVSSVSCL